jgi:Transposase Tn5 dimerisation domain
MRPTEYDYSAHPNTKGLGQIGNARGKGLIMHSTLVVTTQGLPLGLLTQQIWARKKKVKRKNSKQRPIKDKESYKWISALEQTVARRPAAVEIVTLCDREADVYEFLLRAEQLSTGYVVRAYWNRALLEDEEIRLWESVAKSPVAGELDIEVAAKKDEPARIAKVAVRFCQVEIKPPYRSKKMQMPGWKPISVWAVYVKEIDAPKEVTPLEWMLLTNVAVHNFDQAVERIAWYCQRWSIELYHKVIKSGCRVEACLLETAERLERYLALMCVVAWRLFWLTHINRHNPDASCTTILAPHEWQSLYCKINKTTQLPPNPPTVRQAVRWIAKLGGFLARKNDGEPGITVIWRGWHRLNDIAATWLLFNSVKTYG